MATLAFILAIIGVLTSFFLVGIVPAVLGLIVSMVALLRKPTILANISLGLSIIGILLPVFFFINSYGFVSPVGVLNGTTKPLEEPLFFHNPAVEEDAESGVAGDDLPASGAVDIASDGLNEVIDAAGYSAELPEELIAGATASYDDAYAHCYDYFFTNREDYPVSASFTFKALNANGEVIASVIDTLSGIPAKGIFVAEAVFNKNVGAIEDVVYEATVHPCGDAVYATDLVEVKTSKIDHGERISATNHASEDVRVNVHVLFYDGTTLVQNSWVVPSNTQKFTITPGTTGTTDAVCRAGSYTRMEVYYGALRVPEE